MLWVRVRQNQQKAIIAVITQLQAITTDYRRSLFVTGTLRDGRTIKEPVKGSIALREKYITNVDRIKFVDCPDKFRTAWLTFTQTLERADNPLYGLAALIEGVVSVVKLSSAGTQDAMSRLDKLNPSEAFRRVEMVALEYDVQISDR